MWDIYPVDMYGHILGHYKDAVLTEWTDELDSYKGGFKFVMPDISYNRNFDGALTEVQLWLNGKFFDWGVATKPKSTPNQDGKLEVQCNSLLWYFTRRVFGSAFPRQFLNNPDFEIGPIGAVPNNWAAINCYGILENDNVLIGSQAVRCINGVEQGQAYLQQTIAHATTSIGDYGVLTAWFFIEEFDAPADGQRGIFADSVVDGVSQDPSWYPLTMSQPTNVWTRAQAATLMPGGVGPGHGYYDCRLYAPKGKIIYDATGFNLEDSVTTGVTSEDQSILIANIIIYAQDPAWGKSNLNISSNIPLTGVQRLITYFFVDNKQIFAALQEFTKYYDGIDFALVFPDANGSETPGTVSQRVFTGYSIVPGVSMGKGTVWSPVDLQLTVNVTVSDIEPAQDADQITTAMIVQSGNSGTGREQGGYVDASHYGGLILETVEQAPEYVSLNGLAGLAKKRVLQLNQGANIPVIKTREIASMPILTRLKVGDIVPVNLNYGGWASWQASYRVVKMVLDPPSNALDLTLNIVSL